MNTKISEYMDINRIEFIITYQCGGACKHCQIGRSINKKSIPHHVLAEYAVEAIEKLSTVFNITSILTFGGEPLYYPDVVTAIHKKATDCGIETRTLITNGYFTNSAEKSKSVARSLADAGVNRLMLSVDSLHQEKIPIEPVHRFAADIVEAKIPNAFLYPAWVVDKEHDNPYNVKTREVLERFSDLAIPVSDEGGVSLTGDAVQYLAEYFPEEKPLNRTDPSLAEPCDSPLNVGTLGINPNGDVKICGFTIGNIYTEDILDIVRRYNPYENEAMAAIMNGGIAELLSYTEKQGVNFDISKYYSGCWDACCAISECLTACKN